MKKVGIKSMKKAVFITDLQVKNDDYSLNLKSWGKVLNKQTEDIYPENGLLTVMKKFVVKENLRSAHLRITSLGNFVAYLNGKRIGRDNVYDELTPLWTDYSHRVFEYEYDLLECLNKKGENIFSARVSSGWWSGNISRGYYGSKITALCAEIEIEYKDGKTEIFATDETWNTAVCGPVLYADIWNGEIYDATVTDPCVYPDSISWNKATLFDDYDCEVVSFEGEYVRVVDCLPPKSATVYDGIKTNGSDFGEIKTLQKVVGNNCECLSLKAGCTLLLDFGSDIVGRPTLAFNANNGTMIRCKFAEMLNDSGEISRGNDGPKGSVYIANYRGAMARFNYKAFSSTNQKQLNTVTPLHTFYGFRYMEITADDDIVIENISAEILSSAIEINGTFECSAPLVNKLYSNIVRGMRGNYLGIPTDCPQRDERYGWTGDTQIFCGAASYIGNTYNFLSKYLGDMRDSQKKLDGAYGDICPFVFEDKRCGNAAWGDAGIIIPYKLWLMYGNDKVIADNYSSMEEYMAFIDRENGLEGPNARYGDWLAYENTDSWYVSICYYYYDAILMKKFSEILSKQDRVAHYKELSEKILEHYFEKYVVDGEITQKTQTAYLLPLYFDMFEGEMRDKTIENLKNKIIENNYMLSTGFVGTGILNQTLAKVGLNNLAYSLLLQTHNPSWLYSVKQGATTVWERWNSYTIADGFGDVGMNSFNHYAYGAVAEWMYAYAAGIRPNIEKGGFVSSFVLAPLPDTRTESEIPDGQERILNLKAEYCGIVSNWYYEDESFVWHVIIPNDKSVSQIEFPLLNGSETITINDVEFKANELNGKISNGKMFFELTAGDYIIK